MECRSGANSGGPRCKGLGPIFLSRETSQWISECTFKKFARSSGIFRQPYVVVISLETPEGGKPGRATEVGRESAAKLIVEGKVRLAEADEQAAFYKRAARKR